MTKEKLKCNCGKDYVHTCNNLKLMKNKPLSEKKIDCYFRDRDVKQALKRLQEKAIPSTLGRELRYVDWKHVKEIFGEKLLEEARE